MQDGQIRQKRLPVPFPLFVMFELFEAAAQGRAVESRAASAFIDKGFVTACLFERSELQVRVLVVG